MEEAPVAPVTEAMEVDMEVMEAMGQIMEVLTGDMGAMAAAMAAAMEVDMVVMEDITPWVLMAGTIMQEGLKMEIVCV
jgi:hypothetical protein